MLIAILKVVVIMFLISCMIAFYNDETNNAFDKGKKSGYKEGYNNGYSTGLEVGRGMADKPFTNLMEDDLK